MANGGLVLYTVYGRPLDYPDEFICRRYDGRTAEPLDRGEPFARGRTLDDVRRAIPAGLWIVETWV